MKSKTHRRRDEEAISEHTLHLKTPSRYSMLREARRVMRLSEFIRTDTERIVREWEEFAKTLPTEADLP
jgi:hypothetical protein